MMVNRILRNPIYAGYISYKGENHEGEHKPIRDMELHILIQKQLDKNRKYRRARKPEKAEYAYLLQELIHCGRCLHAMTPRPGTGRSGNLYPYYACSKAEKSVGGECERRYLPAKAVDNAVIELVKSLELKPEMLKQFTEKANQYSSETMQKLQREKKDIEKQLSEIKKLANLNDVLANQGKQAPESTIETIAEIEQQRADLEDSVKEVKRNIEVEEGEFVTYQEQMYTLNLFSMKTLRLNV